MVEPEPRELTMDDVTSTWKPIMDVASQARGGVSAPTMPMDPSEALQGAGIGQSDRIEALQDEISAWQWRFVSLTEEFLATAQSTTERRVYRDLVRLIARLADGQEIDPDRTEIPDDGRSQRALTGLKLKREAISRQIDLVASLGLPEVPPVDPSIESAIMRGAARKVVR